MYKPESVLENETHKILWDLQDKRICHRVNLDIPTDHRVKRKESEMTDKYLDLAGKLKK